MAAYFGLIYIHAGRYTYRAIYTGRYAYRAICTQCDMHTGRYAHSAICIQGDMHTGRYAYRAICTQGDMQTGRYAHRAICTQGDIRSRRFKGTCAPVHLWERIYIFLMNLGLQAIRVSRDISRAPTSVCVLACVHRYFWVTSHFLFLQEHRYFWITVLYSYAHAPNTYPYNVF
jgi:hypothetical protein